MRAALNAITDELKRLKASGVKSVVVSNESLATLQKVVRARAQRTTATTAVREQPAPLENRDVSSVPTSASKPPADVVAPARYEPPAPKFTVKAVAPTSASTLPPPPKVVLPAGDKQTRWDALLQLVLNDPVCKAHVRPGKKVVLGVGNLDARIFFCGEAPGAEEEEQGEPFVGPAGQLLTKMIQGMGLKRSDIYIGNIMNWRPELPVTGGSVQIGNRPPTPEEMAYCMPYLKAQLEVVNPEIIVALGSTAVQGLFGSGSFKTLGEIRSQWKLFAEKPVMVTYHPSYILRNPTNRSKRAIWEDLLKVMERASLPISEKQQNFFLEK
ncbi:MAG: uracil-DNA glycosylase [Verrucomicrobia bacterium]|nr:uracil-DNA glycosylase [Verrucomicrobiota bacterium]